MESGFETIILNVHDHVSPECSCKLEDMINSLPHISESSFDPVNNILIVKVHKGMITEKEIIKELKRCKISCEETKINHKMVHIERDEVEKDVPTAHEHHTMMEMDKTYEMEPEATKKNVPVVHDHHAMMEAEMKRHFMIAAFFSIPVLVLSPSIQLWLRYTLPASLIWDILLFSCASIVILYGGLVFYKGSITSFKMHTLDMNVLVSLALLSGYLYSAGSTFLFEAPDFYWEISTLATFILFGHWMEMRAVRSASGVLKELVNLIPLTANLIKDDDIVETSTSSLNIGDIILIKPGEKVPIDGVVVEGLTSVNEAMITGESKPVEKSLGTQVIGGSINGEGAIKVKVAKTGEETTIAQIIKLVEQAISSKPRVQKLADRAANYLTLIAIIVGGGAFLFWYSVGAGGLFALTMAITVIVITCPHALGLAIPTVTTIATNLAAKNGMLVKNAEALEIAKRIDTIVFDKTGTLTRGEFGVTDVIKLGSWDEKEILSRAAALEVNSEHTIAKGIVKKASDEGLLKYKADKFMAIPGKGAKAVVGEYNVYVGNVNLMKELRLNPEPFVNDFSILSSQGKTVVYLSSDNQIQGLIAMADIIREESSEAIQRLKKQGLEVAMLTGDNKQTAAYVAKELGLDNFFAEVMPDQKAIAIKSLQSQGKRVAMVGDGINDAPALVQADIGIAIGAGTDVAVESADVVLIKNDPRDVSKLITLSQKTMRKMNENLIWATGYNIIAIPVAAGILVPFGIVLKPEFGAVAMSASSISVVVNALLLNKAQLVD